MRTTCSLLVSALLSLAFLTSAVTATAESTAPAIDCWANALGGLDRLATIRTLERTGTLETGGMKGRFHSWHTMNGAIRSDVEVGPYQATEAFDAEHAWTKSGATPAHDLTDADLERIVSEAYAESLSMFFDDRMKGSIDSPEPNVLVITPEGGRPITIAFDPDTCLPTSIEQPERDRVVRVEIQEWMDLDGIRFPKRLRQSTGDPAYDATIVYDEVRINTPIDRALFEPPADAETGIAWGERSSISLPMELTQNHPYVPVTVNGEGPSMFILDTGADFTVIERGHGEQLGLPMEGSLEVRGAGEGTLDAALISSPVLRVGDIEIPSEFMVAIPLGPLSLYEGRPMQGILGYDVLSRFVVEIDYSEKRVVLFDPDRFVAPSTATSFDISFDGNTPLMKGSIRLPDGRSFEVRLTLDTGNRTALILHRPFVETHDIRDAMPTLDDAPLGMGIGGMTRQDLGRLESLSLGPFTLKEPLTSFSNEESGANANPEIDGNIGGEVLRRFTLWIDYGHKRILLRPNDRLADRFEYDMSGLVLRNVDTASGEPVVIDVLRDSPAAKAGIEVGDVIQALDGVAASSMSLDSIRTMLRQPDRTFRLQVQRGSERIETTIATRRML